MNTRVQQNDFRVRGRVFPFAAIIGQEQMKLALLLCAVNPAIGGVLIRGEKGTAKSTAVRGLANLLPLLTVVKDCIYNCDPSFPLCPACRAKEHSHQQKEFSKIPAPMKDLPLGATEDMVIGSIDFEAAVKDGKTRFMPGLLAKVHQGVLYIDEVNLLDDHLVDSILNAVESGVNLVEREGMSVQHRSVFILIGTMNPEEGEVRPQILDRFGLAVEVKGEQAPDLRVELLRRRERFDLAPQSVIEEYSTATKKLREKIRKGRELLSAVFMPGHMRAFIAEICETNNVAGHRADLAIERAARAHAAFKGRSEVTSEDIIAVAPMALLHRMRTGQPPQTPSPPSPPDTNDEQQEDKDRKDKDQKDEQPDSQNQEPPTETPDIHPDQAEEEKKEQPPDDDRTDVRTESPPPENDGSQDDIQETGTPFKVKTLVAEKDRQLRTGSGRRSRTRSATKQGRYVKSTPRRIRDDLALDATIRAAAPFQAVRKKTAGRKLAVLIKDSDIREKIRERRVGNILVFVVDGSGSMGAQRRMVETKAAIMSFLLDAYQKRDKVAMIVFRGKDSEIALPPTGSVEMAGKLLAELPIGCRTPLSSGLSKAWELLDRIQRKEPTVRPLVILMTDGKANVGLFDGPPHKEALALAGQLAERHSETRFIVVDTEPPGAVRLELARQMAEAMNADYFRPETLKAKDLINLVKEHRN